MLLETTELLTLGKVVELRSIWDVAEPDSNPNKFLETAEILTLGVVELRSMLDVAEPDPNINKFLGTTEILTQGKAVQLMGL